MNKFDYKEPKLCKDKDNKKWFVRYAIKAPGEKDFKYLKEYGGSYLFKSLNDIANLKERERKFNELMVLMNHDLKNGVDIKNIKSVKDYVEKQEQEANQLTFDYCYNHYLKVKGYINPVPKKLYTAQVIKNFISKHLRPFLESKNLLSDINQINKKVLLEYMNSHYLSDDPKLKWTNTTFNNKQALLSAFFRTLVKEDLMQENPASKIDRKEGEATERFGQFTKEERDLIFDYFDNTNPFLGVVARFTYYSYVRSSELTRLRVYMIDLDSQIITIPSDIAKGQKDGLPRYVRMSPQLTLAVKKYLSLYDYQPDCFLLGWGYQPHKNEITNWQKKFTAGLKELKEQHPDKFKGKGLTKYALKHSGITDFVNDNAANKTSAELFQIVQSQARHEKFSTTSIYWKRLKLNANTFDGYVWDGK